MVRVVSPFDAVTQAQLRRVRPRGLARPTQGLGVSLASMQALQSALGERFHIRDDLKQWMAWSHQPAASASAPS